MQEKSSSNHVQEFLSSLVFLTIGFVFFLVIYVLKRHLSPASIIFYEGIGIGAVSAALFVALFRYITSFRPLSPVALKGIFLPFVSLFLLNYAFIITFPTLLDRSISITLISVLDKAPEGRLTVSELNNAFLTRYVAGDTQTKKRISEQVATGNMRIDNDVVEITPRGRFFAQIHRLMARAFNIPRTYVEAER